jgi:hypothetical protein
VKALKIAYVSEMWFPEEDYRWGVTITGIRKPVGYMYGHEIAESFDLAYHDRLRDWCEENGVIDYRAPQIAGDAIMFKDEGEAMLFFLAHA